MRLSIVTICFNDKGGFVKTAKSIVNQTFRDFEWIVIDGGSTDGTIDIIKEYSQSMSYWVSEPDQGIYNAMNKGTAHVQGDYCLYLNSGDCFCSPKSLERVMRGKWDYDVIACDMFFDHGRRSYSFSSSPDHLNITLFFESSLFHQATFVRSSIARKYPYDENYKIVSDCKFWFEVLMCRNHSYSHLNIPLTIFDTTGISSVSEEGNKRERFKFLSEYISVELIDKYVKDTRILSMVESSMFISPFISRMMKWGITTPIRFNKYFYGKLRDLYYQKKYCDSFK